MKNFIDILFGKKNIKRTISFAIVILAYVIITVLTNTIRVSRLFSSILVPVCCYIVLALSLNLCVGFSGELSLGHAGFMAVGGFTAIVVSGILSYSIPNTIIRLLIAIIAGGLVSGLFGLVISIPVLKLSGDYLAIVTLAFGQIIKSIINNVYLGYDAQGIHFSFVTNTIELAEGGRMLLLGPMGSVDVEKISSFTAGFILILFVLFVIYTLIGSKNGRAITAARDNRIAAESIGINITKTKTLAFVVSAVLAGMGGALYALNNTSLQPSKFDFNTSISILVYVVFGGLGNITGTIIATSILYVLPELLRSLQDYRMLIYSVVLIAIMLITNNTYLGQVIQKVKLIFMKKGDSHE
ncbi:MAG: branched-chain amino acid ABC transporter permease [Erysipelotrichaceae bacterium]|nr:branched-chain amino acid ABC transporter permease [Erysipelotrichaceae bacterium]